eukprot:6490474-Amphidinium_carterae.2
MHSHASQTHKGSTSIQGSSESNSLPCKRNLCFDLRLHTRKMTIIIRIHKCTHVEGSQDSNAEVSSALSAKEALIIKLKSQVHSACFYMFYFHSAQIACPLFVVGQTCSIIGCPPLGPLAPRVLRT